MSPPNWIYILHHASVSFWRRDKMVEQINTLDYALKGTAIDSN